MSYQPAVCNWEGAAEKPMEKTALVVFGLNVQHDFFLEIGQIWLFQVQNV